MISFFQDFLFKQKFKNADKQKRKSLLGTYGEYKTCCMLKKRGMKLLQKNWRHKHGELDIIARDKTCLVFVEVRTRDSNALVTGVNTLSHNKKQTLKKTAHAYMGQLKTKPNHWRFDVANVTFCKQNQSLEILYHESVTF